MGREAVPRAGRWAALLVALLCTAAPTLAQTQKPKVRAITAFVRIERATYKQQIDDALKMLRPAKAAMERGGYEVQTIRIVTQDFPQYTSALTRAQAVAFLTELQALATKEDFALNIGRAILREGDSDDAAGVLTDLLSANLGANASLPIASEAGVSWDAVRTAAGIIKQVAEHSPRSQGTFNFAATAMIAPYTPFYPAAYHTGAGRQFAIGLEGANVVDEVFRSTGYKPREAEEKLTRALAAHSMAIEKIALAAAKESGWAYIGVDATPAPLGNVSIGAAIEAFTGERFGASGTLTAAAIITRSLRAARVKHAGYNGLMLPILEDARLAQRWSEGAITIDALLAYSAVCATGLDTVPLPGDITEEQLARILGDVATLAVKWNKPLAARLQPIAGKKAGERTSFDGPILTNAIIQKLP
jgi:hypothetical protein